MQKKIFLISAIVITLFSMQVRAAFPYELAKADSTATLIEATTKEALQEFKSLSKQDRKLRIKYGKAIFKEYKADKKAGKEPDTNTLLMAILCVLLPPLAVYLHEDGFTGKFWLSLLLTLLFWLPGVIYALLVIFGEA